MSNTQPDEEKKKKCAACGTSPVNHRMTFVMSVADGTIGVFFNFLFGWTTPNQNGYFINSFQHVQYNVFKFLRMAVPNTDPEKAITGRSRLIWDEAIRRGIPMEQLVIWGRPLDQYRAKIDGTWFYFESLPIPPWAVQSAYGWLDDKFKLKQRLEKGIIPTPRVRKVSSWNGARKAFTELTHPVIIKPRLGSRGRHTTTNIQNETQLREGYDVGRVITPFLIEEEHLDGSVCRATVIGGKLVGFFKADAPTVTGDGVRTVEQLIADKNAHHSKELGDIYINEDIRSFIARKGYTLESALPKNETLALSAKTGRMYGGVTREMFADVHPKLRAVFDRITEYVPAPVLGFDLIIKDPTADPDTERWGIIECNSLPFIDLHYFALEGPKNDLAPYIWDLWKKEK